jgi:hypothetical protein
MVAIWRQMFAYMVALCRGVNHAGCLIPREGCLKVPELSKGLSGITHLGIKLVLISANSGLLATKLCDFSAFALSVEGGETVNTESGSGNRKAPE